MNRAAIYQPLRLAVILACCVVRPFALSAQDGGTAPACEKPSFEIAARGGEEPRFFLVGGRGETVLRAAATLSDGSCLIAGGTTGDLSWAGNAPQKSVALATGEALPGASRAQPFILHVAKDFSRIEAVYLLPRGSISEVSRIRSTEAPGQPTGQVYLSGRFGGLSGPTDAYWIARLDANFVSATPARLMWIRVIKAPGRGQAKSREEQEGDYAVRQPWDVRSDGQVIYAEGEPYSHNWSAMRILKADGSPGDLPGWGHRDEHGAAVVLRAGAKNSLRSSTLEDFEHRQEDENGNLGRKGRYPDDVFFSAHDSPKGPGYTGYRVGQHAAQRVSQLAIDRRDNSLYFGTSTQSRLPGGLPDFEPAVVAMDANGRLTWWARGYVEIERGLGDNSHGDIVNSPPDQYVDFVAVDYARNRLLVLGRCHGNNNINFWRGDAIVRNRNKREGFLPGFTGSANDIHVGWLGSYGLADGKIYHATYVAELAEGGARGVRLPYGNLAGWPDPKGWNTLNTTSARYLAADAHGRAIFAGNGRHPYTTTDALFEGVKPGQGVSRWSDFVRAYESDLGAIAYSTLASPKWDVTTGEGATSKLTVSQVLPLGDGVLVVGTAAGADATTAITDDFPVRAAPDWGASKPVSGSHGVVGVIPMPVPLAPVTVTPLETSKRRR